MTEHFGHSFGTLFKFWVPSTYQQACLYRHAFPVIFSYLPVLSLLPRSSATVTSCHPRTSTFISAQFRAVSVISMFFGLYLPDSNRPFSDYLLRARVFAAFAVWAGGLRCRMSVGLWQWISRNCGVAMRRCGAVATVGRCHCEVAAVPSCWPVWSA